MMLGGGRAIQEGFKQFRMDQPGEELEHRIDTESEEEKEASNDINKSIVRLNEGEDWPEHLRNSKCDVCELEGGDDFIFTCSSCTTATCICCEDPEKCRFCKQQLCQQCLPKHNCEHNKKSDHKNEDKMEADYKEHEAHAIHLPPIKKFKSSLDDSEGEMNEEDFQDEHEAQGQEGDSKVEMPPRKILRTKTAAEDAHPAYEARRAKKRPIDFETIKVAATEAKRARRSSFVEFTSRQSRTSLGSERQFAPHQSEGVRSQVHESHTRALVGDIIFCIKCGKFSIKKVEGLANRCSGAPAHSCGRAQLKKMLKGHHPVRGALSWPDGSDISIIHRPFRLDHF